MLDSPVLIYNWKLVPLAHRPPIPFSSLLCNPPSDLSFYEFVYLEGKFFFFLFNFCFEV